MTSKCINAFFLPSESDKGFFNGDPERPSRCPSRTQHAALSGYNTVAFFVFAISSLSHCSKKGRSNRVGRAQEKGHGRLLLQLLPQQAWVKSVNGLRFYAISYCCEQNKYVVYIHSTNTIEVVGPLNGGETRSDVASSSMAASRPNRQLRRPR